MCHPEIIKPNTGDVLEIKEGLNGELVYTSIDRECQPLIRFRTRDHVVVTQTECECGRTGYCMKCIGRTDDMLIVSGVNVYPSAIRDIIGTLLPRVTGELLIQLQEPPPSVKPPMKIKVEHGNDPGDLGVLKSEIETLLRENSSSVPLWNLYRRGPYLNMNIRLNSPKRLMKSEVRINRAFTLRSGPILQLKVSFPYQ